MYFLDNVRGAFWGDLGGSWPPPRPDFFFFGLFLQLTLKRKRARIDSEPIWGGRPGGVWGGWGGAGGPQGQPARQPGSQPASQAARQAASQPARQHIGPQWGHIGLE